MSCLPIRLGIATAAAGGLWLSAISSSPAATNDAPKPAVLKVSGYGILGNRELKRILSTLELAGKKPAFFSPDFVEDAAMILTSRVKRDGYLQPSIWIHLGLADGSSMEVKAGELIDNPLPRPLLVTRAEFKIDQGVLFHYEDLQFSGLETITEKQARSYFIESGALLHLTSLRSYTPEKLRRGLSSLTAVLEGQGYRDAKAEAEQIHRDDKTGAVRVHVTVRQGRKFLVRSVREEFFYEEKSEPAQARTVYLNQPYSRPWLEDFILSLKTNQYPRGYADVSVDVKTLEQKRSGEDFEVALLAQVKSGPQVGIAGVSFQGEKRTRRWYMERRVRVKRGELLNRVAVEQGRYRLAKLGIFDSVDLDYREVDPHTREVLYRVKEGKTRDLSLLFGYGSYELLRGGFEANENNIWGLAHHAQLKAVQSFKASSGEFTYTIPDFLERDFDLFANGSGLRREEISFTREEYGGGMGVHKFYQPTAMDVNLRYNYQILNALSTIPQVAAEGVTNPAVGAIITDLKFDRRDNPLYPRKGYKVFLTFESATEYLGGDVNYERIEVFTSWHHALGEGRWVNLGLSHGVALSLGSTAQNLPFNKRFFPGGQDSIRGYQLGQASPRNDQGQLVGAETYALATMELEQALTPRWSLVAFSDSLGFAHRLSGYPFDSGLFSVGIGIRWRTLIGPVRLEYGHNLNPRRGDPSGTLQFSLGFPF
jgi:outer membrane protein assembly complex protein YaeT